MQTAFASVSTNHIIDCDADPFVPDGWKVEEHEKSGQLKWDASKIKLFVLETKTKGESTNAVNLLKQIQGTFSLNANVPSYLLAIPMLIPEKWKGKRILFCGTTYCDQNKDHYVCYLDWLGVEWRSRYLWLGSHWIGGFRAAVLAH